MAFKRLPFPHISEPILAPENTRTIDECQPEAYDAAAFAVAWGDTQ